MSLSSILDEGRKLLQAWPTGVIRFRGTEQKFDLLLNRLNSSCNCCWPIRC